MVIVAAYYLGRQKHISLRYGKMDEQMKDVGYNGHTEIP